MALMADANGSTWAYDHADAAADQADAVVVDAPAERDQKIDAATTSTIRLWPTPTLGKAGPSGGWPRTGDDREMVEILAATVMRGKTSQMPTGSEDSKPANPPIGGIG